jgi:apolipoprotein N-acyltransferase
MTQTLAYKMNKKSAKEFLITIYMRVFLAVLSGGLLSIPFLSPSHFYLTWVGIIPLLIAIRGENLLTSYCLGALSGLIISVSVCYWIVDFLMLSKGYGVFVSILFATLYWLYCAQLMALITLIFNWIKQHTSIHEFILLPIILTSIFAIYPMIFTTHLGDAQSQFLSAIQAIEFVGVHGLNFIIALSNVMILAIFSRIFFPAQTPCKQEKWLFTAATLLLVTWFVYGWHSNHAWESLIKKWETVPIGLVQPNETPSLDTQTLYPGYSRAFPPEMAMTERLANAGAKLVIWPESKYKAYFDQSNVDNAYREKISALNTQLLFQDIEHTDDNNRRRYNTAVMLSNNGQMIGKYQKIKRIAFGEYVPFASDVPMLKHWAEGFFGSFLDEIQKGTSFESFTTDLTNNPIKSPIKNDHESNNFNIIPLICYETMFPIFVAQAVSEALKKPSAANVLVALSSDGWFGFTHQPYQHVNSSVLRAVENRLPLIHVLNNGPSIVAMPNGNVIFKSDAHQAGGYLVDVPYSPTSGGSFYSDNPLLFIYSVYIIMFLIILYTLLSIRQKSNMRNL